MKRIALGLAMVAAPLLAATPSLGWDLLGSRDVRDAVDRDSIALRGDRQFDRIRLCVYERPVHFINVQVRFANGRVQDVPVQARIRPGQCTRNIDLNGSDRNIASVDMVYEANTPRRGAHASIRLFGE